MAVLLLWSSAGAAIYQHICRSSGILEVSLMEITPCEKDITKHPSEKSCCENPYTANTTKASLSNLECCDYDHTFQKIDTESTQINPVQESYDNIFLAVILPVIFIRLETVESAVNSFTYPTTDPDPILLRVDTYALLQTFLC